MRLDRRLERAHKPGEGIVVAPTAAVSMLAAPSAVTSELRLTTAA
jgi:hypothetical protein